jgi:hypothetical protein
MANAQDIAEPAATAETPPEAAAAEQSLATATDQPGDNPFSAQPPTIEAALAALPHAAAIDLGSLEPDQPARIEDVLPQPSDIDTTPEPIAAAAPKPAMPRYALAAAIALAVALGALGGAGIIAGLSGSAALPVADASMNEGVAQLRSEISALKALIAVAQRDAGAQFGKLSQRLDGMEKAQAEPAAKLAKIAESLNRIERGAAHASSDVTGSIGAAKSEGMNEAKHEAKPEPKPVTAEGWRLRDYHAGRAVVENPAGRLFEVGPGANLPGLGRVESIRRQDGRIVVATRNGNIAASLEWRRPAFYLPYRY